MTAAPGAPRVARTADRSGARRAQRATLALLVCLIFSFGTMIAIAVSEVQQLDFAVYYLAGDLYARHADPYTVTPAAWDGLAREDGLTYYTTPYRYPPTTAALVRLLVPLGARTAAIVWSAASALAMIGGALLLGRALGGGWRTPLALLALFLFYPAYHTLLVGQVNGFVFGGLALAFWALLREREAPLGAGLALGMLLKVTPVAILACLVWQRRWRSVVATLAAVVVLVALTLPVTGVQTYVDYGHKAYGLTEPHLLKIRPGVDTVRAALGRLLLPAAAIDTDATTAEPTGALVAGVSTAIVLVMAALSAIVLWRRPDDPASARPLEFALVVALAMIAAPFTYYHQYVLLLVPLLVVVDLAWTGKRRGLLALLAALFVAVNVGQLLWVLDRPLVIDSGLWRFFSFPFALAAVLWWVCLHAVWRAKRRLIDSDP